MSHSGQGNEPQPHAHEGVVLPASGEPWVPGQQATPAAGQPWGQPWGPDAQQQDPQGTRQERPEPPVYVPEPYLPDDEPEQPGHGAPYQQPQALPEPYGEPRRDPYGQPQHGRYEPQQQGGGHGLPQQQDAGYGLPPQQDGQQLPELRRQSAAPGLPPAAPEPGSGQPHGRHGAPPQPYDAPRDRHQPLPPPSEETQVLPAPAAPGDSDATQYIPPVAGGLLPAEEPGDSTQFLGLRPDRARHGAPLPPVNAQGGHPGAPGGPDADPTQYIPPVPAQPQAQPQPAPAPPPPGRAPFGIRPGAPGERQPPAEFDDLFRQGPGGPAAGADSTQQLPRFDGQPPHGAPQGGPHGHPQGGPGLPHGPGYPQGGPYPYDEPQGRAARRSAERRRLSPLAVAGMVIAGCIVAGLGAGAAMSGGEDDEPGDDKKPVAASEAASDSATPAADPAEKQAKDLDALLADSNDSRSAVINAVKNIGACKNLGQAATDLREAAEQRNGLVTRLSEISVDELPGHEELTASLNSAWKASAAADSHYAAWADQAAGKNGCKKGKAKHTGRTAAGNKASGEATTAKKKAAGLWNPIAKKYGLTERQYIQL
ncbi:chromosomal replication initiator protein DnaA [Streptomyces lycii]|uniref:Uncharacterized protein n=1 Tax=Streptomyces lycii TaxID=2654337 RepID=A0ABQ7FD40_9ACTN|nr:hypothetical protein [Streptomyces lycii]KAF4405112.1 hypothetical protein GCU69_32225 [Streptomyces lycii]